MASSIAGYENYKKIIMDCNAELFYVNGKQYSRITNLEKAIYNPLAAIPAS